MQKEIRCTITGRVQLVMFRDFAERKARSLGITGTVQNMPDGSVWVVAQGEESVLEKYIAHLQKGSVLSRVDKVSVIWSDMASSFSDFEILY
ncbi:acylphosphatase [Patescibacteria group bacterium]|nr:MAG: acylphosphatase [Patescibacteria group bacterium]